VKRTYSHTACRMMSGGNWWRANEISIGHLTHERDVGDRWRDKTELAINLHKDLVQMPAPLRIGSHLHDPPLSDLGGEYRPKPVPPKPDGLVADIDPALGQRSSTLRSDSGYLTYIITTRRMTSGELLKYRNGLLIT
jgi:hypothetical protein